MQRKRRNCGSVSQVKTLHDRKDPSYPSSNARKSVAEPESLDIKVIAPIGMRVCRSFCAHMIGPMEFVLRWSEKFSKELQLFSKMKTITI